MLAATSAGLLVPAENRIFHLIRLASLSTFPARRRLEKTFSPYFFTLPFSFFPQITPPTHRARMAAAAPRAKTDMAGRKTGCRGSGGAALPT